MAELYAAVVARGRQPHWYLDGQVPDTVDGRFDTIAAVLSMVLLRLEAEPEGTQPGVHLTERFVDDMDGQLRQEGVGDVVVGKHIGKMMAMLGGRLGAYRDGLAQGSIESAVVRNIFRGKDPGSEPVTHVAGQLATLRRALDALPIERIVTGEVPA